MKIALVTPHFPPDKCGVGDYTARLALELASMGHKVTVFTAQQVARHFQQIQVVKVPAPWTIRRLMNLSEQVLRFSPDCVVVQYTPYLYAPGSYGIHASLPTWFALLKSKLKGVPLLLNAHELHYPVHPTPKGIAIGLPQFGQWLSLAAQADHVFVTWERAHRMATRCLPWRKDRVSWLPVGANVDEVTTDRSLPPESLEKEERELFAKARVPERHKLLLHFGGAHPTRLFPFCFRALDQARKKLGPDSATLAFVGLDPGLVDAELERAGRMDLKPFVRALGYLPNWQALAWIKRSNLLLAPYLDGISTRRGSAMAALAQGKPVLTTRAWSTDRSLGWESACRVVDAKDIDGFANAAGDLLAYPEMSAELSRRGRELYETRLSWPVIARGILEKAEALGAKSKPATRSPSTSPQASR